MNESVALFGLLGALSLGVVSPGPSFVRVARIAVAQTRANAVGVALGMGVGSLAFAAAALAGLQVVLAKLPTFYLALRVAGGLYLCFIGWQIARHAREPLNVTDAARDGASVPLVRSFLTGLTTHLANPKTAAVYASVFAAFLPRTVSSGFVVALLVMVFAIEFGWYALVAMALSARAPQRAYLAWKTWIDRAAGAVMGVLGAKLVIDAVR